MSPIAAINLPTRRDSRTRSFGLAWAVGMLESKLATYKVINRYTAAGECRPTETRVWLKCEFAHALQLTEILGVGYWVPSQGVWRVGAGDHYDLVTLLIPLMVPGTKKQKQARAVLRFRAEQKLARGWEV